MTDETLALITVGSAVLTVIGTVVTLVQAAKVRTYREQVAFDLRKISIAEIVENLKRTQDECRKLVSNPAALNRGKNIPRLVEAMQRQLDHSMNQLLEGGPDVAVRQQVAAAQEKLRLFQSANQNAQAQCASDLHVQIQTAISTSLNRVVERWVPIEGPPERYYLYDVLPSYD